LGYLLADILAGGEFQQGFSNFKTFKNRNGNPDTLMLDDAVNNRQYFGFTQLTMKYKQFIGTVGFSLNRQRLEFSRLNSYPYNEQVREFGNSLAPRFALLYKLSDDVSVYTNIAKGFSPPTTAELLPTGGSFNPTLRAEDGWNYEIGSKGDIVRDKLSFDLTAFLFRLNNTIVVRRDAGGGNYFENAGNTRQAGVESYLRYRWIEGGPGLLSRLHSWASYSYYNFKYDQFIQVTSDFSGNKLPSVAPHTLVVGIDMATRQGFYCNLTYNYTDNIPLNDANTAFAASYNLLGARLGYKLNIRSKYFVEVFAGGDNLLNEQYSLGNDINGFGGRYYNVAPGINFFAGLSLAYSQ
jgi:iron complex outermembrane receptor protein